MIPIIRHPGEGRGLRQAKNCCQVTWVPAFAGMTVVEFKVGPKC